MGSELQLPRVQIELTQDGGESRRTVTTAPAKPGASKTSSKVLEFGKTMSKSIKLALQMPMKSGSKNVHGLEKLGSEDPEKSSSRNRRKEVPILSWLTRIWWQLVVNTRRTTWGHWHYDQ